MNPTRTLLTLVGASLLTTLNGQIAFTSNNDLLPGTYGAPGCVVDMNGDHLDDVVRFNGTQMTIAYQQEDGSFMHETHGNATVNPNWSIAAGDLTANGYNDILIGNGSRVSFMYADDGGTGYTELYFPDYIFSQRSNFVDIDNDGNLDAFVCHDVGLSKPYRNDGTGTVAEDQTMIATLPIGGNYSSIWTDLDNDGHLDLYISKCRGGAPITDPQRINLLYRNNGDGTFSEVGSLAGLRDSAQTWTTVVEDFNNDGYMDAFIVNHTDANRLMFNNGDGTFTEVTAGSGIAAGDLGGWEGQGADFDNDGWIDILSDVGGGIYRNNGDGTFTNISVPVKRGGIGDLNNDGWLDYQRGGTIHFNNGGTNHWLKIELQGIVSNLNGIGSRLELYGPWGIQIREIRSGQGFANMNTLQGHFGIGQETSIDSLVIKWPSGIRTVLENPGIDQLHIIPEATCIAEPIEVMANGPTTFCPGESVELIAEAGFGTYQWNNGATGQSITVDEAGGYTVVATDDEGCVALAGTVAVQVIIDALPTVTVDGPLAFCEGGATVLESDTEGPLTWSDGQNGGSIIVGQGGTYTVTGQGACGEVTSAPIEITVFPAPALTVEPEIYIPVAGTATLEASADNVLWYANVDDTESVGSGNFWETPFLSEETSFWAEAWTDYGGEPQVGGKPDNSGSGGIPSAGSFSLFNAEEPFILERVTVYAPGAGERTINLCGTDGTVLQSATFDLAEGTHDLDLEFDVPAGEGLSLRCPQNDLFRNNGGVSYPYAIGTVGQLYTSGFGPTYYYYFYDWQIRLPSEICVSERQQVDVLIGTVGIDGAADGSEAIAIFPVPANDLVRIVGLESGAEVVIFDATGRQVMRSRDNADAAGGIQMNVSSLASGIYVVRVSANGSESTHELIIAH